MDARVPDAATDAPAPRVLVVDHNKTNLGVLARRISEAGHRIATADGAEAALAQLHRNAPDLLLSELMLPGMDGVELARAIRGDAVHRDLPLIFIAGKSRSEGAVRALAAGADDVIRKPFHFEVLAAKIARQLDRAKAVKNLQETNAVLDARVVRRAIELGEMRDRWLASEAERQRLEELVRRGAV
jgi:DNA-binding response OmpR family regulator